MTFEWRQYFTLACSLELDARTAPDLSEAKFRTAISRAYYSALIKARNRLHEEGERVPKDYEVHRFVENKFSHSTDPSRQQIGENLRRLRTSRGKADYDNYIDSLAYVASLSVRFCGRALRELDSL